MTRLKFKQLIEELRKPDESGFLKRDMTIQGYLSAFRSLTAEWTEDRYNELGFELPRFNIPKFHVNRPSVQEVSDRTIRKVEIEMEKWLASGRASDRDAFVFCFFALYCGMRAGDICEAKWSIFRSTAAGMMVVFTPHKTLNSTSMTVSFTIDHKTYCKIEPLIGRPDDYVIPRHENYTSRRTRKHGEFEGLHGYLRRKVNRMLANCGIGNEFRGQKKTHALRKYFETEMAMSAGCSEAAKACGHSLRIQSQSYLGTFVGKVS